MSSALFPVVWLDLRTQSTVERLINKAPGKDKNHLKVRPGWVSDVVSISITPSRFSPVLPSAQDRPSHQHLLQCREAPLAAGQRGRRAAGGAERARPVRHGGLVDHLGKSWF